MWFIIFFSLKKMKKGDFSATFCLEYAFWNFSVDYFTGILRELVGTFKRKIQVSTLNFINLFLLRLVYSEVSCSFLNNYMGTSEVSLASKTQARKHKLKHDLLD